jgi:hypothetical protein
VLTGEGGEISIFVERRGAYGHRDIGDAAAAGQILVGGGERRGCSLRQRGVGRMGRVERCGAQAETWWHTVVGSEATEVGSLAADLSWIAAVILAEPENAGW